jgi:hypothetical protein
MTGDLTLGTDKIKLDATEGTAEFAGIASFGKDVKICSNSTFGKFQFTEAGGAGLIRFTGYDASGDFAAGINTDGSAEFKGSVTAAGKIQSGGNPYQGGEQGVGLSPSGYVYGTSDDSDDPVFYGFTTGKTTPNVSILAGGRILVGTSSSRSNPLGVASNLQIEGSGADTSLSIIRNGGTPYLQIGSTGGTTQGSLEATRANQALSQIIFSGSDGSSIRSGAQIDAFNDQASAWAFFDCPTRLVFSTTADGSSFPEERLRINNNGYVRIMCQDFGEEPSSSNQGIQLSNPINSASRFSSGSTTSSVTQIEFINGNGVVGTIVTNGSATSYVTSSDYRLKKNVVNIVDGITRVKQLQPRRFNFIADDTATVDGFLAHEAQTVVPEAVTGEKDGEDMQGIDQSKLVPLLTAALQEAIAKIETLEQRLSDAGL